MLTLLDVVRLTEDLPELGLVGSIVDVTHPCRRRLRLTSGCTGALAVALGRSRTFGVH